MRIEELKGKTNEEQSKLIAECPICKMEEALDNPKVLEKKILVFRGNYDGFCTDMLCARIVEYIPSEDRWQISDVILFDMDGTGYCTILRKMNYSLSLMIYANPQDS